MKIDESKIGICPTFHGNSPSHCPKCGNTDSFSKEYMGGMKTGDFICRNCGVCVENYVDEVMNLNLDGTPKQKKN